jgi:hypothetical protein
VPVAIGQHRTGGGGVNLRTLLILLLGRGWLSSIWALHVFFCVTDSVLVQPCQVSSVCAGLSKARPGLDMVCTWPTQCVQNRSIQRCQRRMFNC